MTSFNRKILIRFLAPDGAPDLLRRGGQLDVLDAEFGERVDKSVHNGGERRRRSAFTAAAHAQWVGGRRHLADLGIEKRKLVCARQRVIHEACREQLPALAV